MLNNQEIKKLSEYVLLNACAVSSSGLYNGKSGMTLSLFEAARYLNDEPLEDHAFELLEETLLVNSEDIGFENGLSGVGYVLLYLIDNEFIDADFDDFFGKQTNKILDRLTENKYNSSFLLQHITCVHFLASLKNRYQDNRINEMLELLMEELERLLSFHFFHFKNPNFKTTKWDTLHLFSLYLQLCIVTNLVASPSLIQVYKTLCEEGRAMYLYESGYYLSRLNPTTEIAAFAEQCKRDSIQNLNPELLNLREIINLLDKMRQEGDIWQKEIQLLESYLVENQQNDLEKSLVSTISKNAFQPGYGYGIARLIGYASHHLNLI